MAEDDEAVLSEVRKLPLAERVSHKNWKARGEAYDSIASACERAVGDSDVAEFGSHLAKASLDGNAAALDRALTATLRYLSVCSEAQAARIAGPLCMAIAKQNLKQRAGIVRKSAEVCLALIELEQAEVVLEHMATAYENKTPKVVIAALEIVAECLSEFGTKVLRPSCVIRELPKLFEAKQVPIREGVKKIAVELAGWTSPDIVKSLLLKDMPDIMRKDTEKLMDENALDKKQAQRFTRREAAIRAAATQSPAAADAGAGAGQQAQSSAQAVPEEDSALDAYDFAKPENVLAMLHKDLWEGVSAAKWTVRRDSLQSLKQLASAPRLASGDYADVVRELRKVLVKDSNVVCVAEAAGCLGALAKGLRKDFAGAAKTHFGNLLDKLKDKNTNVCSQSAQACIIFHKYCLGLDDIAGDFVSALSQKNPKLKAAALQLLQECAQASSKESIARAHAELVPAAAAAANDPMPNIREAALQLLTVFALKAGSMKPIDKYAEKLDDARKKKLEDMIAAAKSGKGLGGATAAAPPVPAVGAAKTAPSVTQALSSRDTNRQPTAAAPPGKKPLRPAATTQQQNSKSIADDDDAALQMGSLSKAEVEEKLTLLIGDDITSKLKSANWKERLEGMEQLQSRVRELKENTDAPILIQGLSHLPGWGEKNFQVLGKAFELIKQLAQMDTGLGKKDAFVAITGLVAKLSDGKLKGPACEALSALSEAVGPQFISAQLHKQASSQKNPKVLSEALGWMSTAVEEFGLKQLDVKQLIEWMKVDLGSSSAPVRTAAIALLGRAHRQLGPGLDPLLSQSVKPALMQTLRDTFMANPVEQVVPVRSVRGRAGPAAKTAPGRARAAAPTSAAAPPSTMAADADDLLPRTDISASVTGRLADSFSSAKWNERSAALEEVSSILRGAGGHVQPNIGNLISLLKGRLSDTNANLVTRSLVVASELAAAMGTTWDKAAREFCKSALECLGDKKKPVRDGVVTLLEAWARVSGPDRVLPALADYLASPKAAMAEGKAAAIQWAKAAVHGGSAVSCLESAVRVASLGVLDKGAETREAGTALMLALAQEHGRAQITAAIGHLNGPAKRAASEAFEKVAASKSGMAALQDPGTAPEAAHTSTESTSTNGGSRPSSRGAHVVQGALPRQKSSAAEAAGPAGPCLALSTKKEERARRLRGRAGKFEAPGEDEEDALEAELGPLASEQLRSLLFSKDFQKHLEAIDMIMGELPRDQEPIMASLDLILRWCVVRLCDPRANTTCLLRLLDLCRALLEHLEVQEKQLTAAEAACLLPCIVEKSGHNADRIRAQHRDVLRVARRVHPVPRVVEHVTQGISSKSSRTRVESIEAMCEILAEEGLAVFDRTREKPFPAIAQMVSDRDKGVRAAALALLQTLYQLASPSQTWGLLGKLTSQQQSLIEERFKHRERSSASASLSHTKSPAASDHAVARQQSSWQTSAADAANNRSHDSQGAVTTPPLPDLRRMTDHGTAATPMPAATPMARPSLQMPSLHASSDSITPLGPAALAARQLNEAEDQIERWSRALQQLRNRSDETVYVEGMKMVSYDLMDAIKTPPVESVFQHYVNSAGEAVEAFADKVVQVFAMVTTHPEGAHRRCSYCLNALMQVYCFTAMAKAVPQDTLKKLVGVVLLQLISPDRSHVDSDNTFLKALNVLMMRVLANSQKEAVIGALLELLEYEASNAEEQSKFKDLTVKCLIKVTKSLDDDIKTDRMTRGLVTALDLNRILLAIHGYFSSMTSQEIKARGLQEDKPLRMAKTLLHKICGLAGYEVLRHMQGIPENGSPPPVIRLYVDLNLQTLVSADIVPKTEADAKQTSGEQRGPAAAAAQEPSARQGYVASPPPQPVSQMVPAEETVSNGGDIPKDRHLQHTAASAASVQSAGELLRSSAAQTQQAADKAADESRQGSQVHDADRAGSQPATQAAEPAPERVESKAYGKARNGSLIAVDANTQEAILAGNQKEPISTVADGANPACPAEPMKQNTPPPAAVIDKREVGKIMQKLGQKGTTEEGLMDLYQYMQKHPNLKLDQIMNLSVASTTFRKYLEDGLKKAAYKDRLAKGGTDPVAEAEEQLPPPEHLRAPMQQRTATTPARKTSYESLMARMAAIRNRGT